MELYGKAAEAGNPVALFRLGEIYWGEGELYNPEKAFRCFAECVESGVPFALGNLGDCYLYGIGTEANPRKAEKCYLKSWEEGNAYAAYKLACMYEGEQGIPKDGKKFLAFMEAAALANIPEARFRMGDICYDNNRAGGINKAIEWYESCMDRIPEAKHNLAVIYYKGEGVERDYGKAFGLFRSLADEGSADAMFTVGNMILAGQGTEPDIKTAFDYYVKSARAGNAEAAAMLENIRKRQNAQLITIDGAE